MRLGSNNDEGHGIAVDSTGAAYVAGFTTSTNFPTASPRQGTSGGGTDAFIAKLTQPIVTISAATATVAENGGTLNLTVTLSISAPVALSVNYATSPGTATAGSDYATQNGTLTFLPGQTSQTISIPIINDSADEANETFSLALSSPVGARLGTPISTAITITDDDPPPTVAFPGANFYVGESASSALVSVQLSAASSFTITVAYATSNGTATAGSDYTSTSGTLTFAPGQTSLNISIPILNDVTVEANETINLTLSSPTNATLGSPNPATLTILDDDGVPPSTDEVDRYDTLGNLRTKGALTYTYGTQSAGCATGALSKPHAVVSAGAASYCYDQNGNMLTGGGRISTWDTENRPTQVVSGTVTETYGYDADGERIGRTVASVTTVYLGGLWEETSSGTVKQYYMFNGTMVAVRDSSAGVTYLHSDHLGSVSVATDASGALASRQFFGPWGNVLSGGVSATSHNYTGQYLDSGTGLLYYHARYYDPVLARFVSADSVVPGSASGSMNGMAIKSLTVDFHEPGFVAQLSGENRQPFWFLMSSEQRQKAGSPWGPANPQTLNRYSYVLNNCGFAKLG